MASTSAGGSALGLQALGGIAGIAGNLIPTAQGKQDKRISGGQEDPATAALRKRLAATNAQTAMSVAASQQGVNPALAQRNAQQALAQQQTQTNANLAQNNVQSTLASRAATRGQQQQQLQGTLQGVATGLVGLGTSVGAQAAYDASGPAASPEGVPGVMPQEGAAGLGSPLAVQGAAGLSAPVPSTVENGAGLAVPPQGSPVPSAPAASPSGASAQDMLSALQAADPATRMVPAGQMQMRDGSIQPTAGLGEVSPNRTTMPNQAIPTPALQEAPVAQALPAAAPPQATPAPAEVALSTSEQVATLSPDTFDDPYNSMIANMARDAEARGNDELKEIFNRVLLQRVGQL